MKVSALLLAGRKVSQAVKLVEVSHTTVYAIKRQMNDGECAGRYAGSGRKTVVARDSLRSVIRGTVFFIGCNIFITNMHAH